jgi:hypothetical protein
LPIGYPSCSEEQRGRFCMNRAVYSLEPLCTQKNNHCRCHIIVITNHVFPTMSAWADILCTAVRMCYGPGSGLRAVVHSSLSFPSLNFSCPIIHRTFAQALLSTQHGILQPSSPR